MLGHPEALLQSILAENLGESPILHKFWKRIKFWPSCIALISVIRAWRIFTKFSDNYYNTKKKITTTIKRKELRRTVNLFHHCLLIIINWTWGDREGEQKITWQEQQANSQKLCMSQTK
jgi:hypothetical protein